MIGFLCCCEPFDNAFRATDVRGIFVPMGAHAAVSEERSKIYAAMYQVAGEEWVKNGAVSHAICLHAHNEEAIFLLWFWLTLFRRYSFNGID